MRTSNNGPPENSGRFIGVRAFTASGLEFYLISHMDALLYTFRDVGVNESRCFPRQNTSVS